MPSRRGPGAINQRTSLAKIKATIRLSIIVLVDAVPENEMSLASAALRFYCIAVRPSSCENGETVRACESSPPFLLCICFPSVF